VDPRSLLQIGLVDLIDVVIVGSVLAAGLVWLRSSRARLALPALAALALFYLAAGRVGLQLTTGLLQGFFAAFLFVLVVVFQDDLRRLFEQLSAWGLRRRFVTPPETTRDTLTGAVVRLAATRTGALLVLPGREPLERHLDGGIELGGRVSGPLLLSLLDPGSPGHDGAVLVVGDRVERFAVHLPLSTDHAQLGPGGTRHAAALGLAERTDALCIVVSEERGTVSVARDGRLRLLAEPGRVAAELEAFLAAQRPPAQPLSRWRALRGRWREALAGFALAGALWALRVPGANVVETRRQIPVVVENLPAGFELESVEPAQVEATLRGRRLDIALADPDALRARVDGLLVQLGRRTFELGPERVEHPPDVEVLSVDPRRVKISVRTTGEAPPDGR
jgi:DNA integrity scanning protein DisA with diadenylate cyclase activity